MAVKPIPEGYRTVTPYLITEGAARLIDFMKEAFGAEVTFGPMLSPNGRVSHAEVKIGDSMIMTGEPGPESKAMPAMIHLYLEDADATYERALRSGATSVREPRNEFYGDRSAGVRDPFGNVWWLATHVEDVSPEELERRTRAREREEAEA